MPGLADALRDPIPLPPNRLTRFYAAGSMLDEFRGAAGDGPEDWVGSATPAWTPPGTPATRDGLSQVEVGGQRLTLDELLRREPVALAGEALVRAAGPTLGVLVKLLDAGQRLPVHCHPTRRAARRLLGSPFGKTEAWLILATEPASEPRVWAGLRRPVERTEYRAWIDSADTDALLESLIGYDAKPGDVFFVPGGTPHAIGRGVFLLELQEPTDFSVVAETRGVPLPPGAASLGLGWDEAIGFFELELREDLRQPAARDTSGVVSLLGPAADPYFRAYRVRVDGHAAPPFGPAYAVGVVLTGTGTVAGPTREIELGRGTTFALPAAAVAHARLAGAGLELVWCLGPDAGALA